MRTIQIPSRNAFLALTLFSSTWLGCTEASMEVMNDVDLASADASMNTTPDAAAETLGPGPYSIVYTASGGIGIDQRTPITAVVSASGDLDAWNFGTESHMRGSNQTGERYADALSLLGRWNGGTGTKTYTMTDGFHYGLVLKPTAAPPMGTTSYTQLKATSATIDDGTLAVGTIKGKLSVLFAPGSKKAGLDLTIDMPGDAQYTGTTTGGIADPSQSTVSGTAELMAGQLNMTSTGISCAGGSPCKASVRAYVGGGSNNTARAVVVFVISSGGSNAKVLRGAMVFGS